MSDMLKQLKEKLIRNITHASQIFIVGHNNPDYDCIGAALGVSTLAKALNKEAYVIVNDLPEGIEPGVKKILEESQATHNLITLDEFRKKVRENALLITTDVNKTDLISVKDDLDRFSQIMIIDHHQEDDRTINTSEKYIDVKASSTSEMITHILNFLQIKYKKDIANYLLAGIILDTKRFIKNTRPQTLDAAEKLFRKGADYDAVNKLFISNYLEDKLLYKLIFDEKKQLEAPNEDMDLEVGITKECNQPVEKVIGNTSVQIYKRSLLRETTVSYTVNRKKPTTIYKQADLAKTADKMLKYVDVSVVLGYINDNDVGISARSGSKCDINVGNILGHIQTLDIKTEPSILTLMPKDNFSSQKLTRSGGGNEHSAGAQITCNDIENLETAIMQIVRAEIPGLIEEEAPKELVKKEVKVKKY